MGIAGISAALLHITILPKHRYTSGPVHHVNKAPRFPRVDRTISALFITERREDHHPKDAATVTATVFQTSGGYPYKVDHESVHRSDSSPANSTIPSQRSVLDATIPSSSCRPRLDVQTAGDFRLSGQVISAQVISGRTGGMRGAGSSTSRPKAGWMNRRGLTARRQRICQNRRLI